jgi:head-tail adaptor
VVKKRNLGLAGSLAQTVTLQQRTNDLNGDPLGAWQDVFTTPARVIAQPIKRAQQGEIISNDRRVGVQPIEVTMRLDLQTAQIDSDWRIVWLGWAFDVTVMAVDELLTIVTVFGIRSRAGDTPP